MFCVSVKIVVENWTKFCSGSSRRRPSWTSPKPCEKSVATLVWRWSWARTLPPAYVIRTREVHIGCTRPWRKLSVRCHMSFTGLRSTLEIAAASYAASANR